MKVVRSLVCVRARGGIQRVSRRRGGIDALGLLCSIIAIGFVVAFMLLMVEVKNPVIQLWSKVYVLVVLEIMAVAFGIASALAVWYPKLRGHWGRREPIACGCVTHAGFAIAILSISLGFVQDLVPALRHTYWLGLSGIIGLILAGVGYALDAHAHERASRPGLPEANRKPYNQDADWKLGLAFAAVPTVILLTFVWLVIS
jgi:hypothetical protein